MTYNELATILAHYMGDPTSIPFREEAKRMINTKRSTMIRQSLEKSPGDRRFFLQTVLRDLQIADRPSCPGVPDTCPVLRTVTTVPEPLRANGIYYDYIGTPSRQTSYPLIDAVAIPTYSYNKYTGKRPYIFEQDDYLYLVNDQTLKCLMIVGIFDSPSLTECQHDAEYPAPLDVQDRILMACQVDIAKLPRIKDSEINIAPNGQPTSQPA